MTIPITPEKLDARLPGVVNLSQGEPMSVIVTIPEPLATKAEAAAKSHATSLEHYVIEAVARTVAQDAPTATVDDDAKHPLEGFLADDPELADRIVEGAYALRALPLRSPTEGGDG